MFWKKRKANNKGPKIIGYNATEHFEITRVRTSKPIKPAKSGIRIDNLTKKY